MKSVLFIPVLISVAKPAPAPSRQESPVVVLSRDTRGLLRSAPCARFDLSDPAAFLSDDTVRAKRCVKAKQDLKK